MLWPDIIGMHPIIEFLKTLLEFFSEIRKKGVTVAVFENSALFANSLGADKSSAYVR